MCLIVVGWHAQRGFPLAVAANRDEFHHRPTATAAEWADHPGIYAGRDLEAGGTWLGIGRGGRFAAVTNVREPGAGPGRISRGELPRRFLAGDISAAAYCHQVDGAAYAGFNLLVSDGHSLWYCSNRDKVAARELPPGIYGLSNHLLDSPWPKLLTARERFAAALASLPDPEPMFGILADDEIVPDTELPETGVPLEWERMLSAIFVRSAAYGTRASTVLTVTADRYLRFEERSFGPDGRRLQSSRISTGV
jgi:uncharacterized protein with NRDE domain